MEETKQMTCQGCSKGCTLQIGQDEDGKTTISGGRCPRGTAYASSTLGLDETQVAQPAASGGDRHGGRGGWGGHGGHGGRGRGYHGHH